MQAINKGQIWKNKTSGNEIKILKTLGPNKWWVRGKLDDFKIRSNMIHDNYELIKEVENWRSPDGK